MGKPEGYQPLPVSLLGSGYIRRVQLDRRDYEHNFFVKCSCFFRVNIYGFDRAKELAIGYRKRLEAEWEEQQVIWARLDANRESKRLARRAERERLQQAADFEDQREDSIWGTDMNVVR